MEGALTVFVVFGGNLRLLPMPEHISQQEIPLPHSWLIDQKVGIAVGPPVTRRPPHRSRRAVFSHRALQEYSRPQSGLYPGSCQPGLGSPNNPWSLDLKAREQLRVASPGVTAPLATPIAPLLQDPHGAEEELFEAGKVAVDPVVVVVPTELGIEPRQQHSPTLMSVRLAPWGEALQGVP